MTSIAGYLRLDECGTRIVGSAVASGPFFTDTFTEASETALSAHTADTGESWTTSAAFLVVGAGDGFAEANQNAARYGWVDLGVGNVDLRASLYNNNAISSRKAGVTFRVTDASNLLLAEITAADTVQIRKLVAGSLTTLASAAGVTPSSTGTTLYELKTILNGDQIDVSWDGAVVLQHTLSGADFTTFPITLTKGGITITRPEPRIDQLDAYTL